jgi:hypothetical protein
LHPVPTTTLHFLNYIALSFMDFAAVIGGQRQGLGGLKFLSANLMMRL